MKKAINNEICLYFFIHYNTDFFFTMSKLKEEDETLLGFPRVTSTARESENITESGIFAFHKINCKALRMAIASLNKRLQIYLVCLYF